MLEELLRELIDAINANTAALSGSTATEPEAEPEAEAPEPPKKSKKSKAAKAPTLEDVRTACLALAEAKDKQTVVDLLAEYGVGKIGDLDAANYAEVIKSAQEKAAADEEAEAEDVFG